MAKAKTPDESKLLTQLRSQLRKATEALDSVKAENKELIGRQKVADKSLARRESEIAAVIEENRLLAKQRDEAEKLRDRIASTAEGLKTRLDECLKEHKTAQAQLKETSARAGKLTAERDRLQQQVKSVEQQLRASGRAPILHARDVTALIDELIEDMSGNLGDMKLKEGELRLQVGFSGAGKMKGFVLPTVDGEQEIKGPLQELVIRFDRRVFE